MTSETTGPALRHEALFYRDAEEYVAQLLPFVDAGLDEKEPVLVAVPAYHGDLLRLELGRQAEQVRFVNLQEAGRNPGRILPWVLCSFLAENPGRRSRIVAEVIWPGRGALAYPACVQHEAMVNLALAARAVTVLCAYDVQRLDPQSVADAVQTHPVLVRHGLRRDSQGYGDPAEIADQYNVPLPEPTGAVQSQPFEASSLLAMRTLVGSYAGRAGLSEQRIGDLVLAANEVAINSITHGGGGGTVRIWHTADDVVCEIIDSGHLADPLAGRIPPRPDGDGGRGLTMVHFVCDLVRVFTRPGRTVTRLYVNL